MNQKLLATLFVIFLFAASAFAQNTQESFPAETALHFFLEGEPTSQDAGFDNPKSSWKANYELYLADFFELQQLGFGKTDRGFKLLPPIFQNKKFNQRLKKKSKKILRGSFTKKMLSNAANREVTIKVNLPPDVVGTLNRALTVAGKNLTFILMVTQKVSVKNSAGVKLKDKYRITGFSSLKYVTVNESFENMNFRNISLTAKVTKQENGQLKLTVFLLH